MVERVLPVINEKGLHARASAKFVETVESFSARARVSRDGQTVSGDSIMGLLMLAAHKGTTIAIRTEGSEAGELADALEALLQDRFGEQA
ncbi:MAG: HPr family phosphocarrier protein [Rhodobacteraceae bacterium]|nr:HPr family phosphocarrier protein [Paracoccaceae bacterium]